MNFTFVLNNALIVACVYIISEKYVADGPAMSGVIAILVGLILSYFYMLVLKCFELFMMPLLLAIQDLIKQAVKND